MKLGKLMMLFFVRQEVRVIDGITDTTLYEGLVCNYFTAGFGLKLGKCVVCAISTEGEKIIIRLEGEKNESNKGR